MRYFRRGTGPVHDRGVPAVVDERGQQAGRARARHHAAAAGRAAARHTQA